MIYEDNAILAILDLHPVNIGHTLVIPKNHHRNIFDTPKDIVCAMMAVAQKIALSIKTSLVSDGINIIMNNELPAGQLIYHTHIHIIPRYEGDGFAHWKGKRAYEKEELEEIAEKITSAL